MNKESQLIKDWKERDVQRMRNIITKNYNDKTITQVGYQKTNITRVEDDVWEENGKKWTIKNGIKQTITKFDKLKTLVIIPLLCPECGVVMNNSETNKKLYNLHKKCMDCVIKYETELKRDNKFNDYQKHIINDNINGYLNDLEDAFFDTFINNSNNSFVTEQGDIEQLMGGNIDKEKITNQFKEEIKQIKEKMNI